MKRDVEYLANVMAQGRMVGASWEQIAGRIVQTDLPGLGYLKTAETTKQVEEGHDLLLRRIAADPTGESGVSAAKQLADEKVFPNAETARRVAVRRYGAQR